MNFTKFFIYYALSFLIVVVFFVNVSFSMSFSSSPEVMVENNATATVLSPKESNASFSFGFLDYQDLKKLKYCRVKFVAVRGFKWFPNDERESITWAKTSFDLPGISILNNYGEEVLFPLEWTNNYFKLNEKGHSDSIYVSGVGSGLEGNYNILISGKIDLIAKTISEAECKFEFISDDQTIDVRYNYILKNIPLNVTTSTPEKVLSFYVEGEKCRDHIFNISGIFNRSRWKLGTYVDTDWSGTQTGSIDGFKQKPFLLFTFFVD